MEAAGPILAGDPGQRHGGADRAEMATTPGFRIVTVRFPGRTPRRRIGWLDRVAPAGPLTGQHAEAIA